MWFNYSSIMVKIKILIKKNKSFSKNKNKNLVKKNKSFGQYLRFILGLHYLVIFECTRVNKLFSYICLVYVFRV